MQAPPVVHTSDLGAHVGARITLRGWLYARRSSGKIHFIELRDGFGVASCVAGKKDITPEEFEAADKVSQESAIEVTGEVKEHPKKPGVYEVVLSTFKVLAKAVGEYPISPKEHGTDFLMDHRHLWLRSKRQHAIMRVRHTIIQAIRSFFDDGGFTLIDA